jgi:hypothetical protein
MMLSKSYRVPREIDERELVFDARPKTARDATEEMHMIMKEMPGPEEIADDPFECLTPPLGGRLVNRNPIDRIAELAQELTYGEMITWAAKLWLVSNGDITKQNLPDILWDWAHMS